MENSTTLTPKILTPFNYLDWRADMQIVLHNKGLYKVTMGREVKPQQRLEKSKYLNKLDEEFGFMCIHISKELLFTVMDWEHQKKYGISSNPCLENNMS